MSAEAVEKRRAQGWVQEVEDDVDKVVERIRYHKQNKSAISIAYLGNVVTLWYLISGKRYYTVVMTGKSYHSINCPNIKSNGCPYISLANTREVEIKCNQSRNYYAII